ncbi:MAG: tyrosine-type recombinase/integrase [Chloroflexi bacterium]|nr:tyrosine-type recombinase/integrase [Chloroflexota bacterium]
MALAAQAQAEPTDNIFPATKTGAITFNGITALLFQDLPSESSRRVYRNTFQQWEQFAAQNNLALMDLSCDNIKRFLFSRNLSRSTRISRKSHMQRLLRMVSYMDPSFGIQYIQLRDLNIRRTSKDNAPRRKPRALSHEERRQLLAVWEGDDSHKGVRNYAAICLLLYTAIRNAELVALRWEDLDWDTQTLKVNREKDGQDCILPILDQSPATILALRRLESIQNSVVTDRQMPFRFMFPALSTGKHARFTPSKDVGASTQTIRNIVRQTTEKAGLGKLSSRDIRYTSLTVFSKVGDSAAGNP